MTVDQDILLPLLLAAIIANTVIMAAVVIAGRQRSRRLASTGPRMSATDQALAASYVERSARMSTPPDPGAAEAIVVGAAVRDADAVDAIDPPNEPLPVVEPVTPAPPTEEPVVDAVTEPLSTDGIDPDTGLLDGSAFHRLIVQEDGRLRRYHRPATVVIFELDGLDRLGEHLGDRAAERVVTAMADSIRRLARGADHAGRLGRGRFAVLLPETDEIAAIHYVERVRRASELWLESSAIAVRLVIGWAGTAGDPSLPDTQQVAVERMYAELRRGARREDAAAPSATIQVAPATPDSEASAAPDVARPVVAPPAEDADSLAS